jgi:hypothetical protein
MNPERNEKLIAKRKNYNLSVTVQWDRYTMR